MNILIAYVATGVSIISHANKHFKIIRLCGTSIEEAAEKSGFSDSKYFARVVKKYFNCTPSAFKLYGK